MTEYSDELLQDSQEIELFVADDDAGKRLDSFISEGTDLSRSAAVRLIEDLRVCVSGRAVSKKYKLCAGDVVVVSLPEPEPTEAEPENIPINIVYEDSDIIVVNKEQGMVVHPAPGNYSGTLVNALLYHCGESLSGIGGVIRPGIVHRIDKDTGGLLVVAKNDAAHLFLSEQLKFHGVSRIYYAIVRGNFKEDSGTVNAPIGRHPIDRKKMAVIPLTSDKRSREAVTHWSVVERFGRYTLVRCELETGRTHQIRVHMAHIGHSLLGDETYGVSSDKDPVEKRCKKYLLGQCLFAAELALTHPATKERMCFKAELPDNFKAILDILKEELL